jgi:hypothetical protein
MKAIALLLLCALITSCKSHFAERVATIRNYSMIKMGKQDAPYEIKQAMYDGCVTGIWARGNSFYKTLVTYRQNVDLMYNEVYKFVWHRSYNVCFQQNNFDTFMVVGSKAWSNRLSGIFDIREAKDWVGMPVGGNPNYAPSIMLDESTQKGMPGHADKDKTPNFFGFFGTCQFC